MLAGTALAVTALYDTNVDAADLVLFLTLFGLATIAQVNKVEAPNHALYYATTVFTFAGLLLLPPLFFVALVVGPHFVEWAKERLMNSAHLRAWYLQPFNIANHIINGIAAFLVYQLLNPNKHLYEGYVPILAVVSAACVYLVTNRIVLGLALIMARGLTWRKSGLLDLLNLLAELVLLLIGYITAIMWGINPLLLVPVLAPLLLIHQVLRIPQLQQEAHYDTKTGLLNARHFRLRYNEELARAQRFDRPLSVIMADLDLLRDVNNTYGHIAGDVVLAGIGKIIGQDAREFDIVARFGGEEFAIVLPETDRSSAQVVAERIRQSVAAARFTVPTCADQIKVTLSLGIATFPYDGATDEELTHNADVALYQAKLGGRNRTVCFNDIPHSINRATMSSETMSRADSTSDHSNPDTAAGTLPGRSRSVSPTQRGVPANSHAPQAPPTSEGAASESHTREDRAVAEPASSRQLWIFISLVTGAAALITWFGALYAPPVNLQLILMLITAAIIAEFFQIDLYGQGTISVTAAVLFATAAVAGPLGLSLASAACAVTAALALRHRTRRRPELHKVLFNWANHVVAGFIPTVGFTLLDLPIRIATLPILIGPILFLGAIYFLVETGLVATAIGLSTGQPVLREWRDRYRWLASTYLVLCGAGVLVVATQVELGLIGTVILILPIIVMQYVQRQYVERTSASMREFQRLNRELSQANEEIRQASGEISQLNDELFETLARFFDARDPYVGEHAATVAHYASLIGQRLGWPAAHVKRLRQAALLHDIGKIAIPESILHKPGPLTSEEYTFIQTHADIGASLIEQSQGLRHLAPFVRHHHERWDGKGYPSGLSGEDIPIEARILNICDSVEAMASDRPYRKGMTPEQVMAELRRCAGTQFDPQICEVFIELVDWHKGSIIVNSARAVVRRQAEEQENDPLVLLRTLPFHPLSPRT
jgi:diguanylate cyclase (GGDEF)-like protein/putative nucleotidyltransferase with HDIG domain